MNNLKQLGEILRTEIKIAQDNLAVKVDTWISDNTRKSRDAVIRKREEIRVKREILNKL